MLPPLYRRWLEPVLDGPLPEERRATCMTCAMAPAPDDAPDQLTFAPELKCCTYQPALPNFSVGRLLHVAAVAARVAAGGPEVTPAGLGVPDRVAAELSATTQYGRRADLVCPYLDAAGGCGIWMHREATCASFFCKFEHGARGRDLWSSMRLLLQVLERAVAGWVAGELGGWEVARAADFYRAAADRVDALAPADALALARVDRLVAEVRDSQARIRHGDAAEQLTAGSVALLRGGPGLTRVVGYLGSDPIDLPDEVLAAVRAGRLEGLDVQRLRDFEVLIPVARLTRR